jgi:GcrA cell cycle regulator
MADDGMDGPRLRAAQSALSLKRFDWTAERVAFLRQRWAEGASARTIAAELGSNLTRCAVLGKVHRLGLPQPDLTHRLKPKTAPEPRRPRGRPRGSRTESSLMAAFRALGLVPELGGEAAAAATHGTTWAAHHAFGRACSLAELGVATCRWPVGDPGEPGFAFCGAAPFARRPYCIAHCLIGYRADPADGQQPPTPVARPLDRAA